MINRWQGVSTRLHNSRMKKVKAEIQEKVLNSKQGNANSLINTKNEKKAKINNKRRRLRNYI